MTFLAGALASCEQPKESAAATHEEKNGMVKIEGGTTMMGSKGVFETPYGRKEFPEENPQVKIEVSGFWIDETELRPPDT
jgi:formylglycine-generating enzyme required for sulfatase activity